MSPWWDSRTLLDIPEVQDALMSPWVSVIWSPPVLPQLFTASTSAADSQQPLVGSINVSEKYLDIFPVKLFSCR